MHGIKLEVYSPTGILSLHIYIYIYIYISSYLQPHVADKFLANYYIYHTTHHGSVVYYVCVNYYPKKHCVKNKYIIKFCTILVIMSIVKKCLYFIFLKGVYI